MPKLDDSRDLINTTPDQVIEWADDMTRKGLYDTSTGRNYRTALKSLVGILDPTEAQDPHSLLSTMDATAERWARANRANPSTTKTYRQRATSLLEDYVSFMESPASFKGRGGSPRKAKKTRDASTPQAHREVPLEPLLNSFRFPGGNVVRYALPETFTIDDLRRFVYHLLPAASDFDPGRPAGGFPSIGSAVTSTDR